MYKKITAGNIQDLQKKMNGRYDCHIYIKLTVDMQINKMYKEDYNDLVDQLRAQNITLILENKDGKLKMIFLEKVPAECNTLIFDDVSLVNAVNEALKKIKNRN